MSRPKLNVTPREELGRSPSYRIRKTGLIPAVLYGPNLKSNVILKLDQLELRKTLRTNDGLNTLLELSGSKDVEGKIVLVKELQTDPITDKYLHADLYEVDLKKKIKVEIPIKLIGRAAGVEDGGILQHTSRSIELLCPVIDIPKKIEVDVSHLKIGDSIHLTDIVLPANTEAAEEANITIAACVPPSREEEVTPPPAAEGAEAAVAAEGEAGKPAAAEGGEAKTATKEKEGKETESKKQK